MVLLIAMLLTAKPMTADDLQMDAYNQTFVDKMIRLCKASECEKCGKFFYLVPELTTSEVQYEATQCEINFYWTRAEWAARNQDKKIRDRYERKP